MPQRGSSFIQYSCLRLIHSPFRLPRTSHGTILTFGLFRILFTLPALASEYTYNVLLSSANYPKIATGLPVFL